MLSTSKTVLFAVIAIPLLLACSDVHRYIGEAPPVTTPFDPGAGAADGGYGYGASYGGTENPPPPICDDAFKRCPHEFTYPDGGETTVELRGDFATDGWDVGVPMTLDGDTWRVTVNVPWDQPVQYKLVLDGVWVPDPQNPKQVDDGFGGLNSLLDPTTCGDDFVCEPTLLGDFDWRDAVLYFVFVDRFLDGDPTNNGANPPGVKTAAAFQGGDWAGVLAKLEEGYFTELGVNTLWLSVPADNTDQSGLGTDGELYSAYHAYWPADLESTESRFGTLGELQALVEAAHSRDIKVIVDYAMNHVHESSPVFQQHPEWFWPLNNSGQHCVCGDGCSWDGDDGRRCWFTDYLPDFNFNVSAAREFSVSNAIAWVQDTGIDGFRLDAVKHIEDSWILDLRARIRSDIETVTGQHFYMVGETFTGDKGTIAYYVNPHTMLDGQFDFPLRNALVSSLLLRQSSMYDLESFLAENDGYYGAGIMSTFVGNHDVPRSIHFAQDTPLWNDAWAGGKDRAWSNQPGLPGGTSAFERVANGFSLIFTLPGVPLIYYGDEIGLPGAGDPDNRRFMQWSGYSAGQTYLKNHIAKLATIRAAHPALRRGTRTPLSTTNDTLAFRMATAGDEVWVAINRSDAAVEVSGLPSASLVDLVDDSSHAGPSISVPARKTRILVAP